MNIPNQMKRPDPQAESQKEFDPVGYCHPHLSFIRHLSRPGGQRTNHRRFANLPSLGRCSEPVTSGDFGLGRAAVSGSNSYGHWIEGFVDVTHE